MPIACPGSRSLRADIISPNPAVTAKSITNVPTAPLGLPAPILLIIAKHVVKDSISSDKPAVAPSTDSGFCFARLLIITPIKATTLISRAKVATLLLNCVPCVFKADTAFISRANIPITSDNAPDAASTLFVSNRDKTPIAPASIPSATVSAIITPLLSLVNCAYLVTNIKPAIHALRAAIMPTPRHKSAGSIRLIIAMTAVIIAKAAPTFIIIAPALSAYSPLNLETAIRATIMPPRAATTCTPFFRSSVDIPATIFMVIAISAKAAPTFITIEPALSACSPLNLDIATRPIIRYSNAATIAIPLATSRISILLTSLMKPTIRSNAAPIFNIIEPTLLTSVLAYLLIPVKAKISPPISTTKPVALSIDSEGIPAMTFIDSAMSSKAAPTPVAIAPTLARSPALNLEVTIVKNEITIVNATSTRVMCSMSLSETPFILLMNPLIINKAPPMDKSIAPADI